MMVNLLLTFSTLYGLFMWSNWTVMWFGLTDTTVPMAPFTKPAFVSMLRRNMTRAPTANRSLASNPAVMLQSSFSFASLSAVFFVPFTGVTCFVNFVCTQQLVYFWGQTTEHFTIKVIACFSSGKQTDGWLSTFPKLNEFVCNAPLNELFLKGAYSFSSWTATAESSIAENLASFFWRSLMVSSS